MAREEYILDAQGKNLVRILPKSWRNFRGLDTKYSRGKIFFNVAIEDPQLLKTLLDRGFNVKDYVNKERPDEEPTHILKITIKFNDFGPKIQQYVEGSGTPVDLDQDDIGMLDDADIMDCVIKIRPYDWTMANGTQGVSAYLTELAVQIPQNRFTEMTERFQNPIDGSDDLPF